MTKCIRELAALASLAAAAALCGIIGTQGAGWIDAGMPGFTVDASGHISLLSLPGWADPLQQWPGAVTRVGASSVRHGHQVYRVARKMAPGTSLTYATTRLGVVGPEFTAAVRRFTTTDFTFAFAAILLNGFLAIAAAVTVWRARPGVPAANALLVTGLTCGTLAITAVSAVIDDSLVRLNLLAQSLAPAALLHLAATFPINLAAAAPAATLFAVYTPFLALTLIYQLTWPDPFGTGLLHATASAAIALALVLLLVGMALRLLPHHSIIVRRRAALAWCGVAGIAAAAAAWSLVAPGDWRIWSAAVFCAGALPLLAIAAAIYAGDFFALDERPRATSTVAAAEGRLDVLQHTIEELNESLRAQANRVETLKATNSELVAAVASLRDAHRRLGEDQVQTPLIYDRAAGE